MAGYRMACGERVVREGVDDGELDAIRQVRKEHVRSMEEADGWA